MLSPLQTIARTSFRQLNQTTRSFKPVQQIRTMKIQSIPMWVGSGNNYAYLITDDKTKEAVIIDPANPSEVEPHLDAAIASGSKLVALLNTHWHHDHSGGNNTLGEKYSLPIWGWSNYGKPPVPRTRRFSEELPPSGTPEPRATFTLGSITFTILHTPCHTQDSICYYASDSATSQRAVFTGDTLFIGGCGKFFEGSAEQMYPSLKKIKGLPDDTVVYPGHEYTKSNVAFAKTVLPVDPDVEKLRVYAMNHKETTGVFTVGDEKRHNLFLRTDEPAVQKALGKQGASGRATLQALREAKDNAYISKI